MVSEISNTSVQALPFTDALKLFPYLKEWTSDGNKEAPSYVECVHMCSLCFIKYGTVELVCRIATLLLQIHYQQLVSTPAARSVLTALQDILRSRVKGCKDILGFNLAAMDHLKQLLAARSDAPFKDARSKLMDIRARLSERIEGKTKPTQKKHKKQKKFHKIVVGE
eukprot:Gb_01028 [translate_table: standard]